MNHYSAVWYGTYFEHHRTLTAHSSKRFGQNLLACVCALVATLFASKHAITVLVQNRRRILQAATNL